MKIYDEDFMAKVLPQFHELGIYDPKEIEIVLDGMNQLAEIGWLWYVKEQNEKSAYINKNEGLSR